MSMAAPGPPAEGAHARVDDKAGADIIDAAGEHAFAQDPVRVGAFHPRRWIAVILVVQTDGGLRARVVDPPWRDRSGRHAVVAEACVDVVVVSARVHEFERGKQLEAVAEVVVGQVLAGLRRPGMGLALAAIGPDPSRDHPPLLLQVGKHGLASAIIAKNEFRLDVTA